MFWATVWHSRCRHSRCQYLPRLLCPPNFGRATWIRLRGSCPVASCVDSTRARRFVVVAWSPGTQGTSQAARGGGEVQVLSPDPLGVGPSWWALKFHPGDPRFPRCDDLCCVVFCARMFCRGVVLIEVFLGCCVSRLRGSVFNAAVQLIWGWVAWLGRVRFLDRCAVARLG